MNRIPSLRRLGQALPLLLLLLLFATASCGGRGGARGGPVAPGPTDIPPPVLAARPDGLARNFLDLVRRQQFDQAYGYLGARAQARITRAEFSDRLGEALKTASTRLSYANRWVLSERIQGQRALIVVADRKFPEAETWTWEFEREGSNWKIQKLHLPPISIDPSS